MPDSPQFQRHVSTLALIPAILVAAGAVALAAHPAAPPPPAGEAGAPPEPGSTSPPPSKGSSPTATAAQKEGTPPALPPEVKIGGTWYLSYQGLDANPEAFLIKRGYINIETQVLPYMTARITPDVTLDATGDLKVRLKYAYAKFHAPDLGFVTRPEVEVGVTHMPWLDFEERINLYRMQDTMFMERNGLFNSADLGVTFTALFGGTLSDDYQQSVSTYHPGRWGSLSFGVYNGGGYYAAEKNDNKVLEGRLTLRPLPDDLPGL